MDPFELRLAGALRADAERAVIDIDAVAIADESMRAPARRRRRHTWLLPAVAAALVGASMLGGALLVGSAPDRADTGPVTLEPGNGTMAILLRPLPDQRGTVDVVGLRPTGGERVLRTLTPDDLGDAGDGFFTIGSVSEHGALAVHVGQDRYALLSLADPDRSPVIVPFRPVIGGRWSPTDVFATVSTRPGDWSMQAVDLDGTVRNFGPVDLPGGGPDIVWAADGSGILTVLERGESPSGIPFQRYAIAPIDDGPVLPGVPELSFGWGPRYVAVGGRTLDLCLADCRQRSTPSIWVQEPTDGGFGGGDVMPDGVGALGALVDASFAADDRSVWLMFERSGAGELVLVRQLETGPGARPVVATIPIDPATTHIWFDGFAADDSLIGIGHWISGADDRMVTIVDPTTGRSVTTGETVVGYVTDPQPVAPR